MNLLKPMLLTSIKSYDRSQFAKDVTAGIIVAIIALPLSIALALASGVGPEAGIFTAIVAGLMSLTKVCESKGITMVFSHVNEQPMKVMEKAGLVELAGKDNFCPNIAAALDRAECIVC